MADDIGDTIGSNDPGLANQAYALAGRIRQLMEERPFRSPPTVSADFAVVETPGDFAVVQVYGDGRPVVVVCLRCNWQSGKGERAALLAPNGPARAHERDKHAGA